MNLDFKVRLAVSVSDPPLTATANVPVSSPPTSKFLSSRSKAAFAVILIFVFNHFDCSKMKSQSNFNFNFPDSEGCKA